MVTIIPGMAGELQEFTWRMSSGPCVGDGCAGEGEGTREGGSVSGCGEGTVGCLGLGLNVGFLKGRNRCVYMGDGIFYVILQ